MIRKTQNSSKKLKVSANSFGRVAENRSKLEACTKSNRAKIPAVKSSQNCLIVTMLRGFCSTTNPLCGIWIWSPLYKVMLWNQPFVVTSLQKGEVVIPGANSVQGPRQWPSQPAWVKKSDLNVYIFTTRPSIKVLSMLFTLQLLISVLCKI